jgi:hypothetical protein
MSSKQEQPEKVCIQSRELEVVIASVAKQSPVEWPSHPLSFPRTRESRLDPGSESGVTNDRQDETVSNPEIRLGNDAGLVGSVLEPPEMRAQ